MAKRYALLIGISRYGEGLKPIPSALLDVEKMAEVLLDRELGGIEEVNLQTLRDPGRTELASAIESFYGDKEPDDVLLLYFSGHGFRDDDRQLLLSSAESRKVQADGKARVQRATTLTAAEVRGFMERSRCKRQVVILDCCFSGAFAEGLMAKDEGAMEIEGMLGGKGRAILTSSDAIETSRAPEAGDGLSVYTRFLVEGIQTGAADRQRRGWLDPEDLHFYAKSRVLEVAPSMTPQFFPTRDGHSIRVCQVRRDPGVAYRQKVQELAERRKGKISPAGREILEVLRNELRLAAEEAERMEAEVLQPFRDYDGKLSRYRDSVAATLEDRGSETLQLSAQDWEELKELEQRLKLGAADVVAIHNELGIKERGGESQATLPDGQDSSHGDAAVLPLIQIPVTKGWLVRDGTQWRKEEAPITVPGFLEVLAEGIAITMVQIQAGEFQMGSPPGEEGRFGDENNLHQVQLSGFALGQTPVTQAQWKVVAGWQKVARDLNPDPSNFKGANRPVEQVSWEEAMEFCRRLGQRTKREYSLPSEAQWEHACRAGSTTPFAFGETLTPDLANYDGNYTYGTGPKGIYRKQTSEAGSFPANAWGLQDMHGNVWEWCLDTWHPNYDGAPTDGTPWAAGSQEERLLRGGSWFTYPRSCHAAFRIRRHLDYRSNSIGFRVCVPLPAQQRLGIRNGSANQEYQFLTSSRTHRRAKKYAFLRSDLMGSTTIRHVRLLGQPFIRNSELVAEVNHQQHAEIMELASDPKTRYIIKETLGCTYPPYLDGRRMAPSITEPVYSFDFNIEKVNSNTTLSFIIVSFLWRYFSKTNFRSADLVFKWSGQGSPEEMKGSYSFPLKRTQREKLVIAVDKGSEVKTLNIYVPQAGDFSFEIQQMKVEGLFETNPSQSKSRFPFSL